MDKEHKSEMTVAAVIDGMAAMIYQWENIWVAADKGTKRMGLFCDL